MAFWSNLAEAVRFRKPRPQRETIDPEFAWVYNKRRVYFLAAPSVNLIKIGSSDDPDRRFRELRLLSPVPLEVKAILYAGRSPEKELHNKFAHIHSHGEWFFATAELRREIRGMRFSEGMSLLDFSIRQVKSRDELKQLLLAAMKRDPGFPDRVRRVRIFLQKVANAKAQAEGVPLPYPEITE